MDCSTPGLPVHHQLPEFTQTHVHWVGNAIQPSHPLSSPSPPTFNLSQPQGLFKWISSSHQVAKELGISASASVLPMSIQDWFPLGWTGRIFLQSKTLSRVFSNSTVQKHQFFGAQFFFIVQLSYPYMTTGKTIALTWWLLLVQSFSCRTVYLLNILISALLFLFLDFQFLSLYSDPNLKVCCYVWAVFRYHGYPKGPTDSLKLNIADSWDAMGITLQLK